MVRRTACDAQPAEWSDAPSKQRKKRTGPPDTGQREPAGRLGIALARRRPTEDCLLHPERRPDRGPRAPTGIRRGAQRLRCDVCAKWHMGNPTEAYGDQMRGRPGYGLTAVWGRQARHLACQHRHRRPVLKRPVRGIKWLPLPVWCQCAQGSSNRSQPTHNRVTTETQLSGSILFAGAERRTINRQSDYVSSIIS